MAETKYDNKELAFNVISGFDSGFESTGSNVGSYSAIVIGSGSYEGSTILDNLDATPIFFNPQPIEPKSYMQEKLNFINSLQDDAPLPPKAIAEIFQTGNVSTDTLTALTIQNLNAAKIISQNNVYLDTEQSTKNSNPYKVWYKVVDDGHEQYNNSIDLLTDDALVFEMG